LLYQYLVDLKPKKEKSLTDQRFTFSGQDTAAAHAYANTYLCNRPKLFQRLLPCLKAKPSPHFMLHIKQKSQEKVFCWTASRTFLRKVFSVLTAQKLVNRRTNQSF